MARPCCAALLALSALRKRLWAGWRLQPEAAQFRCCLSRQAGLSDVPGCLFSELAGAALDRSGTAIQLVSRAAMHATAGSSLAGAELLQARARGFQCGLVAECARRKACGHGAAALDLVRLISAGVKRSSRECLLNALSRRGRMANRADRAAQALHAADGADGRTTRMMREARLSVESMQGEDGRKPGRW